MAAEGHEIGTREEFGEEGIRTPDTVSGIPDFESGAFSHSATSPEVHASPHFSAYFRLKKRRKRAVNATTGERYLGLPAMSTTPTPASVRSAP